MSGQTRFGSLAAYEKGSVEVIDDDPTSYAFSNVFEVAAKSRPFEQVVVGQNFEYVLEVVRVEGASGWRACAHDQTALVMDGEVVFDLRTIDQHVELPPNGSVGLAGEPDGQRMGRVVARRGHLTLLPAGRAYRYSAASPSVLLVQTSQGVDSQLRWAAICQSV